MPYAGWCCCGADGACEEPESALTAAQLTAFATEADSLTLHLDLGGGCVPLGFERWNAYVLVDNLAGPCVCCDGPDHSCAGWVGFGEWSFLHADGSPGALQWVNRTFGTPDQCSRADVAGELPLAQVQGGATFDRSFAVAMTGAGVPPATWTPSTSSLSTFRGGDDGVGIGLPVAYLHPVEERDAGGSPSVWWINYYVEPGSGAVRSGLLATFADADWDSSQMRVRGQLWISRARQDSGSTLTDRSMLILAVNVSYRLPGLPITSEWPSSERVSQQCYWYYQSYRGQATLAEWVSSDCWQLRGASQGGAAAVGGDESHGIVNIATTRSSIDIEVDEGEAGNCAAGPSSVVPGSDSQTPVTWSYPAAWGPYGGGTHQDAPMVLTPKTIVHWIDRRLTVWAS